MPRKVPLVKPCRRCGGQKEPGRKRHLCDSCRLLPRKDRPGYAREYNLRRYNLTPEEYEAILEYQGGVCAICDHPPKSKNLAVDHDHKTGLVRGLLCYMCNYTLGGMGGDPDDKIHRMSYYLNHNAPLEALGRKVYGPKGPSQPRRRKKRRV